MFSGWNRLSNEQRRVWTMISGAILVGSVAKVVYFTKTRQMMVDDSERIHQQGVDRLKEAKEFASWSHRERTSQLPELTEEQRTQMKEYLALVERHGANQTLMDEQDPKRCKNCPIVDMGHQLIMGKSPQSSGASSD